MNKIPWPRNHESYCCRTYKYVPLSADNSGALRDGLWQVERVMSKQSNNVEVSSKSSPNAKPTSWPNIEAAVQRIDDTTNYWWHCGSHRRWMSKRKQDSAFHNQRNINEHSTARFAWPLLSIWWLLFHGHKSRIPTTDNEASITFLDFSKAYAGVDWDACPKPSLRPPVGDPLIREHSGYFARWYSGYICSKNVKAPF